MSGGFVIPAICAVLGVAVIAICYTVTKIFWVDRALYNTLARIAVVSYWIVIGCGFLTIALGLIEALA